MPFTLLGKKKRQIKVERKGNDDNAIYLFTFE